MDIFSHGLYGGIAAGRRSRWDYVWAFLFGMAPDLLAFGPFILAAALGFEFSPSSNPAADARMGDLGMFGRVPIFSNIIHTVYNGTHSLFIYAIILAVIWALRKKHLAKLTLAWPLHILVDIPTHSAGFYPTHFLWPVSNFYVDGIAWARPVIFIPNLAALAALYGWWLWKRRRRPA